MAATPFVNDVVKLIEATMKTQVSNVKEREELRKKILRNMQEYKDRIAAANRQSKATNDRRIEALEKAVGIAQHELKRGHPLVAHLDKAIDLFQAVARPVPYGSLDKAMDAVEDWDVASENNASLKNASKYLQEEDKLFVSASAGIEKREQAAKAMVSTCVKDLQSVDNPDVKRKVQVFIDEIVYKIK
jgi:hypothetical protein